MDPSSRAAKKNMSHENEVLLQDTIHLISRPHHQQGSLPHYHHKETLTEVVWTCLLIIRSGQNHLTRHSERGKKTRQAEREEGREHLGMDRSGDHQVPEGSGEKRKMEDTGCETICGVSTTLTVKG